MAASIPVQVIINAVDNASKVFTQVGSGLGGVTKGVMNLSEGQTILAGSLVGLGVAAGVMGKGFIQAAGDMEQNKIAFEVMLGSAEKARRMLEDLTSFAARTPFNLQGVVEAGKQLLAYGFAQEEVITTTEMLGNVAAGLKIPLGDIIYLFGTLRAQGRAYTKDLNQFTARGIPILDELAKQYGITTAEVFKFAETGKIGFADVEKAFQNMTGEGGQFFNLMDKQSTSTLGRISNFEDSVYQLKVALGEALLPSVNELVTALIPLVKTMGEFAKENPKAVTTILGVSVSLGTLGATVLALGPVLKGLGAAFIILGNVFSLTMGMGTVSTVVGAFSAMSAAATAFGTTMAAVGTALLFNPITWIVLAIVAAIAVLAYAWVNNFGDIQGKTKVVMAFIGDKLKIGLEALKMFWLGVMDFANNVRTAWGIVVDVFKGWDPGALMDDATWAKWKNFALALIATKEAVLGFGDSFNQALTSLGALISNTGQKLADFFNYAVDSFRALPEAIGVLLGMAGEAIYNFFFGTIPFAIGYAIGRFEKFVTVDLPAFATLLTQFFTVTLPQTLLAFGAAFELMLINAGLALANFALVTVPTAFTSMIVWLQTNIPIMWNQFVQWIIDMSVSAWAALIAFKNNAISTMIALGNGIVATTIAMKDQTIATVIAMKNGAVQWILDMRNNIEKLINELPGMIQKAFETAKNNAVEAAKSLWQGVSGWMNQVKQLFQDIINMASEAINKATQAFSMGRDQGKRQFGGPVSSANSYLVGEAGPEIFTPSTAGNITPNNQIGKGGGSGTTIQFFITAENIVNSPNERRSFAEAILKDLQIIAQSKNLSVSDLLGG